MAEGVFRSVVWRASQREAPRNIVVLHELKRFRETSDVVASLQCYSGNRLYVPSRTPTHISGHTIGWKESNRTPGAHCHWFARFINILFYFIFFGATAPQLATLSLFTRFLGHTQRRITIGRTPLDEWSARRRDLYLTTHSSHSR